MANSKKSKYLKNGSFYLGAALIVGVILFFSSSQTYEEQSQVGLLSRLLSGEPFKESLSKISFMYGGSPVSIEASGYAKFVEFFIRKAAHFMSFFLLSGALFLGLRPRLKNLMLTGVVSWLSATGYAALDECHQMITGGRSPMFQDVILDSIGAVTAVIICILVFTISANRKKRS